MKKKIVFFILIFMFFIVPVKAADIAEISGTTYTSLTAAINAAPNNTETTIKLLDNITNESITLSNKKNIILDLNGHTFSIIDQETAAITNNGGKLVITNGEITTNADTKGMINNNSGSTLTINDGTYIASGGRQVIFNDGGTLNILGTAYLESSANARATVHNKNNGTVNITGGTIKSLEAYALYNEKGTINIGSKDGAFNKTTPIIQGKTYGIVANNKYNFYDGIIKGGTYHAGKTSNTGNTPTVSIDTDETKINELEENSIKVIEDEEISGTTYKTIYCNIDTSSIKVTFDPNGGEVTPTYKTLNIGDEVGTLPKPVRDEYIFDGWYTSSTGGNQINENTIVNEAVIYYAHWTEAPDVAWIGTTGYKSLHKATLAANSGDTIILGEGEYSLYSTSASDRTGKNLTFIGQGPDKTKWYVGAKVPESGETPSYSIDYSLRDAGTITFKNMTLQTGKSDYLGFAHVNDTVFEDCVINGKFEYNGYESAVYKNTTWNCPNNDYCLWTYSGKNITFDGCTFNSSGKTINVYSNASNIGTDNIIVNFKDNIVNGTPATGVKDKAVMNINDIDRISKNNYFIINISGNNVVNGVSFDDANEEYVKEVDDISCSRLFEFNTKNGNNGNSGHTIININGTIVWENGEITNHDVLTAYDSDPSGITITTGDWILYSSEEFYTRDINTVCTYCRRTFTSSEKGYKVIYSDGVDDEVIFNDQIDIIKEGENTPVFSGTPIRNGYRFIGWDKEISHTVTSNVTYKAMWEKVEEPVIPDNNEQISPKTSDNIMTYILILELSIIGLLSLKIANKSRFN